MNSEPIFNRVLHEFLLSCGADLSFSDCCEIFTGKNRHEVERYLSARSLVFPVNWSAGFYKDALDALSKEVIAIQGAKAAIRKLRAADVPFCVASNGLMAKMQVTLERTQMLPWFEGNMFSAYEVGRSKPAPDVFLHAAQMNGVRVRDCIVVEDSASGFEAASAAEMTCFAYIPTGSPQEVNLFGAHPFDDMKALPELLDLV